MSRSASCSPRYRLHSTSSSAQRSSSVESSRSDNADRDWDKLSDDDEFAPAPAARSASTQLEQKVNGSSGDGSLMSSIAVRVEYAAGLSELIKTLTAHDHARSTGHQSSLSGLEALDNITKQLKRQLVESVAPTATPPAALVEAERVAAVRVRSGSRERHDRCKAKRERQQVLADNQRAILARLERIEQLQLGQTTAPQPVEPGAVSKGLSQLRKDLRASLAALVGDYPDFKPSDTVTVSDDKEADQMSVPEAYTFVAEYCQKNALTPPHYSYYSRENAPSCHQFNGSLSGGVCTVHIGAAKDAHLGGVRSARGTGSDAVTARGAAYLVLAKELKRQAKAGTETALSNGYRLSLAEAEAFIGWYCARYRFGQPQFEHQLSGPHDTLSGVWRATLSIAGRRIGMGEALDKEEATARAQLDMVDYLHAQDEALWNAWTEEKREDDVVKAELDSKVDEVLKKWEKTWITAPAEKKALSAEERAEKDK